MKLVVQHGEQLQSIGSFLLDEFTQLVARIRTGWKAQHNEDGTHGDVTATGLNVADAVTGAGTVASSLKPATNNTYDLGGVSDEPTIPPYAWRNLHLGTGIQWWGSSISLIGQRIPTWSMGYSGSTMTVAANITGQIFKVDLGATVVTFGGGATIGPVPVIPAVSINVPVGITGGLDVSGHAYFNSGLGIIDGMAAPAAVAGYARTYVDSADGDYKIKFGDGTVKTIVTNP